MSVVVGSIRSAWLVVTDRGQEIRGIAHLLVHCYWRHYQRRRNHRDDETKNANTVLTVVSVCRKFRTHLVADAGPE